MTAQELATSLSATESPTGWNANCPNHPSSEKHLLTIRSGDRVQVLLRCEARCPFNEIVAATKARIARAGVQ